MSASPIPHPTTILLIRHAEKLPWSSGMAPTALQKSEYVDTHVLSPKGYERAQALAAYFLHREEILQLLERRPWGAVVAQNVDEVGGWGLSLRPKETVEPLAKALEPLKVPFHLYTKSSLPSLVQLLRSGLYKDRTVLISWAHQQLPDLVKALGVPDDKVPKWNKKRFDVTWVVDFDGKGGVEFRQVPQRLLYGDEDGVMEVGKKK
ncbi:hypothetical protein SpCBS45565_g05358 [Spizellomyces sp. 'palustris']|nr:hypothetical protein SpCBS45565_g05358 [Spizellomyces sp. 'palustris']